MPYPHHLQALNNVTSKPPRALYKMRVCISIHVDREAQKANYLPRVSLSDTLSVSILSYNLRCEKAEVSHDTSTSASKDFSVH